MNATSHLLRSTGPVLLSAAFLLAGCDQAPPQKPLAEKKSDDKSAAAAKDKAESSDKESGAAKTSASGDSKPKKPSNTTGAKGKSKPKDADKPNEKPADKSPEKTGEKPEAKPSDKSPEKPADKSAGEARKGNWPLVAGDWNQWLGSSYRNNVPVCDGAPLEWQTGGFDRKTGAWLKDQSKNIKWQVELGSQAYGNAVVADGKVFVGTNNNHGYLKRYPADVDLGCLLCFRESDGKFLWQHSSEKLPTGRVHDWMLMGICCAPLVEGKRLYFVTSRGEVRCLDTEGYHDGKDDGPVVNEWARQFNLPKKEDPAEDKQSEALEQLKSGKLSAALLEGFKKAGWELPDGAAPKSEGPGKPWLFSLRVNDVEQKFKLQMEGPNLAAYKQTLPSDKDEADVIWVVDMMKEFGVSQHNMCSCSVTSWGDILFVITSNGVDESHINIPAPTAPSFMALDKATGKVLWTDNSPGVNIVHGQWTSPTVGVIGGVPQVLFGGGDGFLYSFKADGGKDGKGELLWKFDVNDKEAKWILGGTGTRNDIIGTPVIYNDKVFLGIGQDPEHGEGPSQFWCIDPTKRGDVSAQLAVHVSDRTKSIAHKRIQAVEKEKGEVAIDNPNSAALWRYRGEVDEPTKQMHRTCGTCAIKNDLLFVADFSGIFHCLDAKTGKALWTYDMLAACWGSPLIAGDYVYIGDEDGDVAIFKLSGDPKVAMKEFKKKDGKVELHPINCRLSEDGNMVEPLNMGSSVYSTPIIANGVMYISTKEHLFAIEAPKK